MYGYTSGVPSWIYKLRVVWTSAAYQNGRWCLNLWVWPFICNYIKRNSWFYCIINQDLCRSSHLVMATCSFSLCRPSKLSGGEDITLIHFVFWALIRVSELSRMRMMQLLLHQAVFLVVFNRVYIHPHCLCVWIAWGNWAVYFSCFESNTSLCSWQEFGLVPPNSWERWANIRRSLNSIFAKNGSRF